MDYKFSYHLVSLTMMCHIRITRFCTCVKFTDELNLIDFVHCFTMVTKAGVIFLLSVKLSSSNPGSSYLISLMFVVLQQ